MGSELRACRHTLLYRPERAHTWSHFFITIKNICQKVNGINERWGFILKLIAYSFSSRFFPSTNQLTAPCTRVWRDRIQLISLVQVQLLVKKKLEDKRQQISVEDGVHGSQTLQMVRLPAVITWLLGENKTKLDKTQTQRGNGAHVAGKNAQWCVQSARPGLLFALF